ncbi:hypothetical protein KL918_004104 [Ogataea parapolymorpha]|nr:hypothetical protein KL918_004104 [Ogataea parapolymorpha]
MPPKVQQSKAAKAAAALAGGKKSKKKWSKGKVKDKAQHVVVLDQEKYDRIMKEVPTYRFVSVSILVDRLKVGGSVARVALKQLEEDGVIKPVLKHSKQYIYTHKKSVILAVQQSEPVEHGVADEPKAGVSFHTQRVEGEQHKQEQFVVNDGFLKNRLQFEQWLDLEAVGKLQRRNQKIWQQLEERRPSEEPVHRQNEVLEVFCGHESEIGRKRFPIEMRRDGHAVADPDTYPRKPVADKGHPRLVRLMDDIVAEVDKPEKQRADMSSQPRVFQNWLWLGSLFAQFPILLARERHLRLGRAVRQGLRRHGVSNNN